MKYLLYLHLERPLVRPQKRDASWIGPAITATDNLFSRIENNIQNRRNRNMTREMWDKQVAFGREQMAAQRKMFDDQISENRFLTEQARKWQLQDTESERKWNSAKEVAARFKQAGINPYLAMVEGAAGQMAGSGYSAPDMASPSSPSGSIGVGSAPSGQVTVNQPYRGEGLGVAVSQYLTAKKMNADIASDKIRLFNEGARLISEINNMDADSEYKDALKEQVMQTVFEARDTYQDRKAKGAFEKQSAEQVYLSYLWDNKQKELDFEFSKEEKQWKREMHPYEVEYLKTNINRVRTEIDQMIKNGASQREINHYLAEEKKAVIADFKQNVIPKHGHEKEVAASAAAGARVEQDRVERIDKARHKDRIFRTIDDTFNYVGDKVGNVFKYIK